MNAERTATKLQIFCIFAAAFGMCAWLLYFSRYGIELMDEPVWLLQTERPFLYPLDPFLFRYLYHPLYTFMGGDLVAYRMTNILLTFFLGCVVAHALLKKAAPDSFSEKWERGALLTGVGSCAFFLFTWLSPTFNYSTATVHAAMLVAIGLLYAEKDSSVSSIAGWLVLGLGGWVAFMGRPSASVSLGLLSFFGLLIAGKLCSKVLLSIALFCALLCLTALLVHGSVLSFLPSLVESGRFPNTIVDFSFARVFNAYRFVSLADSVKYFTLAAFCWLALNAILRKVRQNCSSLFAIQSLLILLAIGVSIAGYPYILPVREPIYYFQGRYQSLIALALPCAAIIAGICLRRTGSLQGFALPGRSVLWVLFMVFPLAIPVGTGGSLWRHAGMNAFFWVLASLLMVLPLYAKARTYVLFFVLASQLLCVVALAQYIRYPFAQNASLRDMTYATSIAAGKNRLYFTREIGSFFDAMQGKAAEAGFRPNDGIIDLSGASPLLPYILGGQSTARHWYHGRHKTRIDQFVTAGFNAASCEDLVSAWVLFAPDGSLTLNPILLQIFGASFPADYELAAQWTAPLGVAMYDTPTGQQLWRPVRPLAEGVNLCQSLREAQ